VTCGDLDVAEVDSRVQHRGDERVPQHVRMGAADAHSADARKIP
jgi:hypothetical protein